MANGVPASAKVLGAVGKNAPDPVAFYLQVASRLKGLGL